MYGRLRFFGKDGFRRGGSKVNGMAKGRQRRDNFEDISSYSSKRAVRRNQKKKKRTGLKVFLSILCVLFVLVGGVLVYASTFMLGELKTTTITKDKRPASQISRCSAWTRGRMTARSPGAAMRSWC